MKCNGRWRAQGIKVHQFEASDLAKAASTYLEDHRAELIELARSQLSTFAQSAALLNEMEDQ